MWWRWLMFVTLSACVRDQLVDCGDGRACPVDTVCVPRLELCVRPGQILACEGLDARARCDLDGADGTCHDGVCLAAACGNGLLDLDEVCDDGNLTAGDGCAATCTSDETCGNDVLDPLTLVGGVATVNEQCDDAGLSSFDGCSSTCDVELPRWDRLTLSRPTPHYSSALAYDSGRDRVVMFGGAFIQTNGVIPVARSDTWEWDGAGWLNVPTTITPPARSAHALVYDAVRRRVVLFGGGVSGVPFADTWEWDGVQWQQRFPPASPPARTSTAAVYDPIRQRMVLFGGDNGMQRLGDTWEWDGTTWTERDFASAPRPSARAGHSMAFDSKRGVVVLTGGGPPSGDTWEYDGTAWVESPAAVPIPQAFSGTPLAFDGTGILAFGGYLPGGLFDQRLWRYDGLTWTQIVAPNPPSLRGYAAMVGDPRRGIVLVVGGLTSGCPGGCLTTLGDVHAWNGTSWRPVTVAAPSPRASAAAALDEHRRCLVMFGGGDALGNNPVAADTWELCGDHWTQGSGLQPPARTSGAMAYDRARRQIVLFGGRQGNGAALGDTWVWNGVAWSPVATPGPQARSEHAMAYDPTRRTILLFGGLFGANTYFGDTWEWNGSAWTELTSSLAIAPPMRARHAMALDPVDGRITLVGGDQGSTVLSDAWTWANGAWSLRAVGDVPTRGRTGLAPMAPRRSLMLFAGVVQIFGLYDDLWELTATSSAQRFAPAGPGIRFGHVMAPTRDGSGVITFGGGNEATATNELWRLRWQGPGPVEACTVDEDLDGDGLAGCADPDCWAVCAPLCPPGAPCAPAEPRCGDAACDATETCRMCAADCGTCLPACGDTFCDPPEAAATCPGDCR